MTIANFLNRLECVRTRASSRWLARCPAHLDRNPSLSICEAGSKILLRCFAACETSQILAALGLELKDLFTDTPVHPGQRPTPKSQRPDLVAVVFRFELAALDRRLRADAVLKAVADFNGNDLSDEDRDRIINVVARAYADVDRAKFLETVADDFRMKAFHERTDRHAA